MSSMDLYKSKLSEIAWCKKIIEDNNYTQFHLRPQHLKTATFFGKTLKDEVHLSNWLLYHNNTAGISEVKLIVELGEGLDGHVHTAHGGFVCTILDEIMGIVNNYVFKKLTKIYTAYLNVTFKRPTPTPGVLLCRAWIEKSEGTRKRYTKATIEDGEGNVYAEAEALFIEVKAAL